MRLRRRLASATAFILAAAILFGATGWLLRPPSASSRAGHATASGVARTSGDRSLAAAGPTAGTRVATGHLNGASHAVRGHLRLERASVQRLATTPGPVTLWSPLAVTIRFTFKGPGDAVVHLPRQLEPIERSAALRTPSGREVAIAKVGGHRLTVSPYGDGVDSIEWTGRLVLTAGLDSDRIPPGQVTNLRFAADGQHRTVSVSVAAAVPVLRSAPTAAGQWTDPTDQGHVQPDHALSWNIQSALGTRHMRASVRPRAGHHIDCDGVEALLGAPRGPIGELDATAPAPPGSYHFSCAPGALWVTARVPSGKVIEVRFTTSVARTRRRYRIVAAIRQGNAAPKPASAFVDSFPARTTGVMTSAPEHTTKGPRRAG